jgi:hypothetical protein
MRSPAYLAQEYGAQVVETWEAVETIDSESSLDAIIIDRVAMPFVSRGWLQNAYKRGVVITTFNVTSINLAEVLNAPDLVHPEFADTPYPGDFYVMVWQLRWRALSPSRFRPASIYESASRAQNQFHNADDFKRFSILFEHEVQAAVHERQCMEQAAGTILPATQRRVIK